MKMINKEKLVFKLGEGFKKGVLEEGSFEWQLSSSNMF